MDDYVVTVLSNIGMISFIALSAYLLLITGEISFGQQAYFGLSAYAAGAATSMFGLPIWAAVLIGACTAGLMAMAVGALTLRLSGLYFSISTLAFAEMMRLILLIVEVQVEVDGEMVGPDGANGFHDIRWMFERDISLTEFMLFIYGLLALVLIALLLVERSRLGSVFRMLGSDDLLTEMQGLNTVRYRILAAGMAGAIAGIGGALYAHFTTYVEPQFFNVMLGVHALAYGLIGGLGTAFGPLVGVAIDIGFLEAVRFIQGYRMIRVRRSGGGAADLHAPGHPRRGTGAPAEGTVLEREIMLALSGIEKRFGALTALTEIDLEVASGDVLGIIGPNGSGKTTLLNIVTGTYAPSGGCISFQGTDITGWKGHRITRLGVARTFQNIRLFPTMTVFQNVWAAQHSRVSGGLLGLLRSTPTRTRGEAGRVEKVLEQVGLLRDREVLARNLSLPARRRLEVARTLAVDAKLVLLDEPAGADDAGRDRGHGAAHTGGRRPGTYLCGDRAQDGADRGRMHPSLRARLRPQDRRRASGPGACRCEGPGDLSGDGGWARCLRYAGWWSPTAVCARSTGCLWRCGPGRSFPSSA